MKRTIRNPRILMAILHDIVAIAFAWFLAYLLRFNFSIPPSFEAEMLATMGWVVILQGSILIIFGLYRGVWRFASISDLKRIFLSVGFASVLLTAFFFMIKTSVVIPRSVLVLNPLLLILMMGGSRFVYRAWKEHVLYGMSLKQGEPVIILGAGEAAIALVKDLARSTQWRVVALLDDNVGMLGREVFGVKVKGKIEQLETISQHLSVRYVIVAMPSAHHQIRREAIELANALELEVMTVPAIDDLMSGKVSVSQIRKVDVEDLLGRDTVKLDSSGLQMLIDQKVVLVSGAGGSIGSELCRQIIKYQPNTLVCLDLSEFSLYQLEQEISQLNLPTRLVYLTGDVKNIVRVNCILAQYQPSVVFHAAAYKHVPMMEHGNVCEALSNNVIGTHTIAKACKEYGISKFVLISTDKAVNPTNVMGASKRLAEMVCQGLQTETGTRFVIVRFGNVLGSSGSVIPKFREQIAKGGPITITHPEITRYFMSIPEAAQLVMQAGLMGKGGEIFVLDMGEPVKIADLALDMIRLSGFNEDEIKIEYVGLRPGEKLYEELLADDEHTIPTPHEKLRIAQARTANIHWVNSLLVWVQGLHQIHETQMKQELASWVEEYSPQILSSADANVSIPVAHVTVH